MCAAAGRYTDLLEAARAYDKAAFYLYGNSAIVSAAAQWVWAWGRDIPRTPTVPHCPACFELFLQTNFGLEACRKDPTEVSSYIIKAKLLADEQKQCLATGGQTACSQQQQGLPQLPSATQMQHTQAGQPAAALQVGPGGVMVQRSLWVAADPQQQQQQVMLVPASSSCASAAFTSSNSSSSITSETLSHYLVPGSHQAQQDGGMLSQGLCGAAAGLPTSVLQAPLQASAPQLQGSHFSAAVGSAASSSCLLSTQAGGLQIGPVMPADADTVLLQPHTAVGAPPHAWQQQQQQMGYCYQHLYPSPPQQQPQLLLQSVSSPAAGSYTVWPCSPALHSGGSSFAAGPQQVSLSTVTPLQQQLTGLSLAGGLQLNVSQFTPVQQHNMLQQPTYFSLPSALQRISLQ